MQKRILTLVMTLACLALASAALAETFTGGSVTTEVPSGWTTMYNEPTKQAIVASPKQECVASIQIIPTDGKNAQQLATMLSEQLKGSEPEALDNGGYFFTANAGGVPMGINVVTTDAKALVFMEIGETGKYPDELKAIRASLRSDASDEQAMLDTLK